MQYSCFPKRYEDRARNEEENRINTETQRTKDSINCLVQPHMAESVLKTAWVIGTAVGGCVCFWENGKTNNFGIALLGLGIISLLGLLVGVIIDASHKSDYKTALRDREETIARYQTNLREERARIQTETMFNIDEYSRGFDKAVIATSIRLSTSKLIDQVANWMQNGFYNRIMAADRRPHIQTINVNFSIKVYRDRIQCDSGTYDFTLKTVKHLTTAMEQAAVARAVAARLQTIIFTKLSKDPSGTARNINISYAAAVAEEHMSECKDYYCATLCYTAANGNYHAPVPWG